MIGNKPKDYEAVWLENKLEELAVNLHRYKPRVFEKHPSFDDALSPQLLEFEAALTRKQAEIESEHVAMKSVIEKLRIYPIQDSKIINSEIVTTEKWIEEKAALLNREFSADSDELGKHFNDVTTDLERRREILTEEVMFQELVPIQVMQKTFRKLDAFSSQINRLRQLTERDVILKDLKAKVEDVCEKVEKKQVIDGNQTTCGTIEKPSVEKRKEVNGGVLVRLLRVFSLFSRPSPIVETMPKIPATLCGMPWNIKRTIVESLDFSPRNRLRQCSSEFKKLIDSTKIQYDRVVFSFYQNRNKITLQHNGRKELELEFDDERCAMRRKVVHEATGKWTFPPLQFHDVAVSHLLRRFNKPNVSIGQLEISFIGGLSRYPSTLSLMKYSLNRFRRSHPNQNKIKVKCVQVKHGGNHEFLRSFLSFVDLKTLENVILDYESPDKQADLALVAEIIQKKDFSHFPNQFQL